jgi:hypothetical protein
MEMLLTDEIKPPVQRHGAGNGPLNAILMQSAFCALPLLAILVAIAAQ